MDLRFRPEVRVQKVGVLEQQKRSSLLSRCKAKRNGSSGSCGLESPFSEQKYKYFKEQQRRELQNRYFTAIRIIAISSSLLLSQSGSLPKIHQNGCVQSHCFMASGDSQHTAHETRTSLDMVLLLVLLDHGIVPILSSAVYHDQPGQVS